MTSNSKDQPLFTLIYTYLHLFCDLCKINDLACILVINKTLKSDKY